MPRAGGHQIDRAGADHLVAADAVAMADRAVEQIGDGGEVDVRVGADVHALARRQARGAELVDEDERPDHRPRPGRKRAANLEVAEVVGDGDDRFDQSDSPGAIALMVSAWTRSLHQVAERGIDGALAGDAAQAGEGGAFDGQREMAFAAAVVAGVADVLVALVFEIEPGRGEARRSRRCDHFGGDGAGGGGDAVMSSI